MKNVKIIVLRKGFYPDLIREHLTEPPEECVCDFFREGDQFLYTGGAEMPAGFCPWAWIDLYRSVSALSCGASYTPLAAAGGGQCGVLYRRAAPGDLPVGGPMRKRRPHNAGAALVM